MWSEVRFSSNMESSWMNKRMINWNEQLWLWVSGLFSSDLRQWWSRGKEVCLLRQPVSWREVAGGGGADAHHVVMLRPHADGLQDHEEEKNHRRNQSTTWSAHTSHTILFYWGQMPLFRMSHICIFKCIQMRLSAIYRDYLAWRLTIIRGSGSWYYYPLNVFFHRFVTS